MTIGMKSAYFLIMHLSFAFYTKNGWSNACLQITQQVFDWNV